MKGVVAVLVAAAAVLAVAAARPHAAAGDCGLPGHDAALDRLRGSRRADRPEAGDDSRRLLRHGRAGPDARGRRRDDHVRPEPEQARRDDVGACRSGHDPGQGEAAVRLRGHGHRVRPPADRRERALRRANADAVEHDERPIPRERAAAPAGAPEARRYTCDHDREPAVHRRRGGRLVARGGEGRDPDSPGLLHLARSERPLQARPRACEPLDAERHARLDLALLRDRHPCRAGRARAAVPVRGRAGWPSGAAAACGVARVREARDARRQAGRRGDEDPGRLVVGLAELLRRRQRPGQGRSSVRVPLDA